MWDVVSTATNVGLVTLSPTGTLRHAEPQAVRTVPHVYSDLHTKTDVSHMVAMCRDVRLCRRHVHRDNVGLMVLQKAAPSRGTTVDVVDVH